MLSVIVPTCNRLDLLSKCLEALSPQRQTLDGKYYEVIVTDDSSNDVTEKALLSDFPWVRWVKGPRKGPAANRNNGAKMASWEWLVFIDDDCLPSDSILEKYWEKVNEGKYMAMEGAINMERPQQRFDEEAPINLDGGCFWSCNIAVKKELFIKLDGFDEGFPYPAMEDIDFHNRIKEITDVCFVREAEVVHPWRRMKPFRTYRKWLASHKYILTKEKKGKHLAFRRRQFNLFVGAAISDVVQLKRYSFKGVGFYFEKTWFHFLMIFI